MFQLMSQSFKIIIVIIFFSFASTDVIADEVKILKEELRLIEGIFLIENDLVSSSKSVYLVQSKTGKRIWINILDETPKDFKKFILNSAKKNLHVRLKATWEFWSDGHTVLNDQKSFTYQASDKI